MHAGTAVPPPAGPGPVAPLSAWLSFRRIVDIPFGACVAVLGSWRPTPGFTRFRRAAETPFNIVYEVRP
jgi:hypothetical protein